MLRLEALMNVILERVLNEVARLNRAVESLRATVDDLDVRQEATELVLKTFEQDAEEIDAPSDLLAGWFGAREGFTGRISPPAHVPPEAAIRPVKEE